MRANDRQARLLAIAVIAVSALAVGAAHWWGVCLTTALSLTAAALTARSSRVFLGRMPLLVFLGAATTFTALQYLPLPAALVHLLSPQTYEIVAGNATLLGESTPGWMALSLDPPATLLELCKLLGLVAFAFVCLRLNARTRGLHRVMAAIAIMGAVLAITGLLHEAVGARDLFGLYTPQQLDAPTFVSPLLNPNHFAAYLAMCTCVALGLATNSQALHRAGWLVVAMLCATTCLLLKSRGATVALGLGVTVSLVLLYLRRDYRPEIPRPNLPLSITIPVVIMAMSVLVLLGAVSAGGAAAELAGTDTTELTDPTTKFGAWRASARLMRDHRWTGVGRGAFEPAFTRVYDGANRRTYSHLENEYLQSVVDWGLPAAAVLAALLVFAVIVGVRRWRHTPLHATAVTALVVLAVQNVVDFNLQLPAVAYPAIALFALLFHVPLSDGGHKLPPRVFATRWTFLGAGGLVTLLAITPLGRPAAVDAAKLAAMSGPGNTASAEQILTAARNHMRRHPADYYGPGVAAYALFAQNDVRAVHFANRALTLHPSHASLHLLAARMLYRGGRRDQSLLEYRHAVLNHADRRKIVMEMLTLYDDPEQLVRGLPSRYDIAYPLARWLHGKGHSRVAHAYCVAILEDSPQHPQTLELYSQLSLELGDVAAAMDAARRAEEISPSANGAIRLARALRSAGRLDEAPEPLERAHELSKRRSDARDVAYLALELSTVYADLDRPKDAREIVQSALKLSQVDRAWRAKLHLRLADLERAAGNEHQAAWEEERAKELRGAEAGTDAGKPASATTDKP